MKSILFIAACIVAAGFALTSCRFALGKSIVVDRVKFITEMARQNLTGEELAQKAGVGRQAIWKMRQSKPVWRTTAGHVAAALGVTVEELKEN